MTKRSPLALTMGDPAGVGPQITLHAWKALSSEASASPFFVIGEAALYKKTAAALGLDVKIATIQSPADTSDVFRSYLPVLGLECPPVSPGSPDAATAKAIISSITRATELVHSGEATGVVTNPISKALLYETGFEFPGHTEFLASLAEKLWTLEITPLPVMMLVGGGLRVSLATIHQPLASVSGTLTKDHLIRIANITNNAMKTDFGLTDPRIAFAGLNPHAGEDGALGQEETDIINPAAEYLRLSGVNISNAMPGDTVFHSMLINEFDAVIAMYHDQGLIPVKTLDIWGGVNTTLGLPFVRTSPDHGTGYDAAAKLDARPDSLIAAIRLADHMADNRQKATSHA